MFRYVGMHTYCDCMRKLPSKYTLFTTECAFCLQLPVPTTHNLSTWQKFVLQMEAPDAVVSALSHVWGIFAIFLIANEGIYSVNMSTHTILYPMI